MFKLAAAVAAVLYVLPSVADAQRIMPRPPESCTYSFIDARDSGSRNFEDELEMVVGSSRLRNPEPIRITGFFFIFDVSELGRGNYIGRVKSFNRPACVIGSPSYEAFTGRISQPLATQYFSGAPFPTEPNTNEVFYRYGDTGVDDPSCRADILAGRWCRRFENMPHWFTTDASGRTRRMRGQLVILNLDPRVRRR